MQVARLRILVEKAGFRPGQPRSPAGRPDGGQWIDDDGATLLYVSDDPDRPPEIPKKPPESIRERNKIAVRLSHYLRRTGLAIRIADWTAWVVDHAGKRIIASLDEPKFLDELQRAADNPQLGYEVHHIVEQTQGRYDGLPEELIEGWRNKVRIPTYRHWEITGWYARANPRFGGLSPRAYLRGKSWHEKYRVGLEALRLHGVLK